MNKEEIIALRIKALEIAHHSGYTGTAAVLNAAQLIYDWITKEEEDKSE